MHLYSGMSTQFMADTANSRIVDQLIKNFQSEYRHKPGDPEIQSWQNSLSRFARVLEHADLRDQGIIVEYRLPPHLKAIGCPNCRQLSYWRSEQCCCRVEAMGSGA